MLDFLPPPLPHAFPPLSEFGDLPPSLDIQHALKMYAILDLSVL